MFKQRLITALILVPLVLLALYFADYRVLACMVVIFVLLAGWEWLRLMPVSHRFYQSLYFLLLLVMMWLSLLWFECWLWVGFGVWALILLAVVTFPASEPYWGFPFLIGLAGLWLLPLLAASMSMLYQLHQGQSLMVYVLCLVWAADIGAYLSGKSLGRHKLMPQVSPGKTIEGCTGGLLAACLVALVAYVYFKPRSVSVWFVLALGTAAISILGDLFISILKRRRGLKDTGHLFPGHGGILDRIDSLMPAVPLFYWGMQYWLQGV